MQTSSTGLQDNLGFFFLFLFLNAVALLLRFSLTQPTRVWLARNSSRQTVCCLVTVERCSLARNRSSLRDPRTLCLKESSSCEKVRHIIQGLCICSDKVGMLLPDELLLDLKGKYDEVGHIPFKMQTPAFDFYFLFIK